MEWRIRLNAKRTAEMRKVSPSNIPEFDNLSNSTSIGAKKSNKACVDEDARLKAISRYKMLNKQKRTRNTI